MVGFVLARQDDPTVVISDQAGRVAQIGGVPLTVEKWTDVGSGDRCYAAAATASSTTSLGADGLNS